MDYANARIVNGGSYAETCNRLNIYYIKYNVTSTTYYLKRITQVKKVSHLAENGHVTFLRHEGRTGEKSEGDARQGRRWRFVLCS